MGEGQGASVKTAKSFDQQGGGTGKEAASPTEGEENVGTWRAPYPFTGCLAHADITFVEETGFVLRILAFFEHNAGCREAMMVRFPSVPLHPHVVEVAMAQLRGNASVSQIRNKNLQMLSAQAYRDQKAAEPSLVNHRFNLETADFRGLYRRHYREHFAVNIKARPEHNVHNWLDPESRYFKSEIRDTIFYYSARTTKHDRLKVCISTPEMREAAWRYCHGGQLVLDGTFGLCASRLLLWIAMGVDEKNSGIPVAMFLFSAPTGTKQTHAGYDTAILTELLGSWRDWLSRPDHAPLLPSGMSGPPTMFAPAVAMTDTDAKERGALLTIWPTISLLLCRFHVRQCWTNRRVQVLKPFSGLWRTRVEGTIKALEEALLNTVQHDDALRLIASQEDGIPRTASEGAEGQKAAEAIKSFVQYLRGTWMPIDMWRSWARKGRADAAALMNVPLEKVITTTNHLESFNGKLKNAHI
ncbi:hypothetical protein C8Q70DRAFT_909458, partial [Cubamyces menziesii]